MNLRTWQEETHMIHPRIRAGDPEIPPGVPPEAPPEQVPLGIPPGGPAEIPGPPMEIPPSAPPEVPAYPNGQADAARGGKFIA